MKTLITPNLIKFTLATIVLTLIFRYCLSASITAQMLPAIIASAVIYGGLMWFTGSYFGKKEYDKLPIYDIGFRFHLATYIAHNGVSLLWFFFDCESSYERIIVIYLTAIVWGSILLMHFFYYLSIRKKSIKNLDKDSLFE